MSGRVVFRTPKKHGCWPGWVTYTVDFGLPQGEQKARRPPSAWEYPVGTVWQCDCERTWISIRRLPPKGGGQMEIGRPLFRREHWWERMRRRWAL